VSARTISTLVWLVACGAPHTQRAAPEPPPLCTALHPVGLAVFPAGLATGNTPTSLALPFPLLRAVIISGKDRVIYTVEMCGGPAALQHSTGFADLDQFLASRIADLGLALPAAPECATASLILGRFASACDRPQTLD
jgi:hypothetical protein